MGAIHQALLSIGAAGGGGGGPDPLDFFTDIWAWYDISQETGLSNNDPMPQFTDWSGNARHATQGTANNRPIYNTAQFNGLPAAQFGDHISGASRYVVYPNMSALTIAHRFIILKMNANTSDTFGVCNGPWNVTTDTGNDVYFAYIDNNIYDSWGTSARKSFSRSGIALNQLNGYEQRTSSGLYLVHLRGTQLFTTGTNTVGFNASPELGRTLFDRNALFQVCEEVICTSHQDDTARAAWKTYANGKWGSVID